MNLKSERLELSLLNLKDKCKDIEIKAEFESEGSMYSDIASLATKCKKVGVPINVKIGGPEAIRDIFEISYLGVDGVIAPLIESSFGVKKFRQSLERVININEFKKIAVLIESVSGIENINSIINELGETINTLIIGRNDLCNSYNLTNNKEAKVDDKEFLEYILKALITAKKNQKIKICMGGKLSSKTINILKDWNELTYYLDYIETRKVILPIKNIISDITLLSDAIEIEKNYISNKISFYDTILKNETTRLLMLESRLNKGE